MAEADARVLGRHVPGIVSLCKSVVAAGSKALAVLAEGPPSPASTSSAALSQASSSDGSASAAVAADVAADVAEKGAAVSTADAEGHQLSMPTPAAADAAATLALARADPRLRDTISLGARIYYHMLWNTFLEESQRLKLDGSVVDEQPPPSPRAGEPWTSGSPSKPTTRALLQIKNLFATRHFHVCLFGAALEVALKARSYVSLAFPRLLQALELTTFDFMSTLESAKRSCSSLPGALVQHLLQIEYQILECAAWRPAQAPPALYSQRCVVLWTDGR